MRYRLNNSAFFLMIAALLHISCASTVRLFQQKDIPTTVLNDPALEKKVLVASRSSKFKTAVNAKLRTAFENRPVYVKFTGIGNLQREEIQQYDAVVMLNQCMGQKMDPDVIRFLDGQKEQGKMIVVTTSAAGNRQPKMKGGNFDAVSSASKKSRVDDVAGRVIEKVNVLIE